MQNSGNYNFDQPSGPIKLRKNRFSMAGYGEESIDRVEGIKEVEELDVLEIDGDMDFPTNIRLAR